MPKGGRTLQTETEKNRKEIETSSKNYVQIESRCLTQIYSRTETTCNPARASVRSHL